MTEREKNPPPGRSRDPVPPELREEVTRLAVHYGTREIAKRVGLSRKIVGRLLSEAGISPSETPRDSDRASLLTPFLEQIRAKVAKGLRATRDPLHGPLRGRATGAPPRDPREGLPRRADDPRGLRAPPPC